MAAILLVWPDQESAETVAQWLRDCGHAVTSLGSVEDALHIVKSLRFEVVVLGPALGVRMMRRLLTSLRLGGKPGPAPAVVVAEGHGGERERLRLTERDVVIEAPVAFPALDEALRGILAPEAAHALHLGPVCLDRDTCTLQTKTGAQRLTRTELRLFGYLAARRGRIISSDELLEGVWGFEPETAGPELVRAHIANIRRKLRALGVPEGLLSTVPGHGYRLP